MSFTLFYWFVPSATIKADLYNVSVLDIQVTAALVLELKWAAEAHYNGIRSGMLSDDENPHALSK